MRRRDRVLPGERSESAIVFCIGAVQFVNILDFVIVMPLGPDFATALHIPMSEDGALVGMHKIATVSVVLGLSFVPLLFIVEDRVKKRFARKVARP